MGIFSCFFLLLLLLLLLQPSSSSDLKACKFKAIYSFGDSLSDTGNARIEFPNPHAWIYPMGMTIGQATGRFSDGWLLLDRIAEGAGLPHTNPYLNKTLDHSRGVNFAGGGTGILSKELRRRWNVKLPYSNSSLDVQLRWFDQFLFQAFKNDTALLRRNLKESLFVIGGGGNDYAYLADADGISSTVEQKQRIMPDIMRLMGEAIKRFVRYGATRILVTGLYEGGCLPNNYKPDNKRHCHKETNQYHRLHNRLLRREIHRLHRRFPGTVRVVYGDVWSAVQWIFDHYHSLGFEYPQKACCGTANLTCGFEGSPYCKKPSEHVYWDTPGHFTDAAYRYMYRRMVPDLCSRLKCGSQRNKNK